MRRGGGLRTDEERDAGGGESRTNDDASLKGTMVIRGVSKAVCKLELEPIANLRGARILFERSDVGGGNRR